MKTCVVDASFVLSFLLPDERDDISTKIFEGYKNGDFTLISSIILNCEVANGLKSAFMSKRITKEEVINKLKDFMRLDIPSHEINLLDITNIAMEYKISVYDASYVVVSKDTESQLLTLDKKLLLI